jgi:hypothetical protein
MADFFIPEVRSDEAETLLTRFAALCKVAVPPIEERVYEIEWTHDGQDWVATVGQRLRGRRIRKRRRRHRVVETTQPLSDPATVLAILPGTPYFVVTDARPLGDVVSAWENPFMAGQPRVARRFSAHSQP